MESPIRAYEISTDTNRTTIRGFGQMVQVLGFEVDNIFGPDREKLFSAVCGLIVRGQTLYECNKLDWFSFLFLYTMLTRCTCRYLGFGL